MGGWRNYNFTVIFTVTAEQGRIEGGERVQREGGRERGRKQEKDTNREWGKERDGTSADGDMWMHVSQQQMRLCSCKERRRYTAKSQGV